MGGVLVLVLVGGVVVLEFLVLDVCFGGCVVVVVLFGRWCLYVSGVVGCCGEIGIVGVVVIVIGVGMA